MCVCVCNKMIVWLCRSECVCVCAHACDSLRYNFLNMFVYWCQWRVSKNSSVHFCHKGWCRLLWNFGMGKKDNKTHTQTHADRCTYTYLLTHSQTQVRMHTLTHRSMHTCSNLQMYAHTHSPTGLLTHRCMHTCTHLLTHSQMHAHMHKFTYSQMHVHTHMHTHSLTERKKGWRHWKWKKKCFSVTFCMTTALA